jgi:hypothetical protein
MEDLVSISIRENEGSFSPRHHIQTGSGAHSDFYPVDTGGSFPAGKAAGS